MVEVMRDVARTIWDEIPPPHTPHYLRNEVSPDPVEARFRRYMKDFERHNPPTFTGGFNVMITENWLQRIKYIFIIIRWKDDTIWINEASFIFTGEAIDWRDINLISNPIVTMKWTDFERLFLGRYFPEAVHNEKMNEFFSLKQGESKVTEYEMKFALLVCFTVA